MPTGVALNHGCEAPVLVREKAEATGFGTFEVEVTNCMADVEPAWRMLEGQGIVSPGQSYEFVRNWIGAHAIPAERQLFALVSLDGAPLMLMPLLRRRKYGMRLVTWFPGGHVGCNAPLVDAARLGRLSEAQRSALWAKLARSLPRADVLYLACVPAEMAGAEAALDGLGEGLPVETLYQARFSSWQEANATQRTKSRRKHDRQQGDRLEALGEVTFEEIANSEAAEPIVGVMFHQRAIRFRQMGVADPFAPPGAARFYHDLARPGSGVGVRLDVLRLNGEIVAVRYNIAIGDTLYCLISSMSEDPAIQCGSPGKQCLLRVMQTVFDAGWRCFDMGAGLTDEKRHWCNTKVALSHYYVPLSLAGRAAVSAHRAWFRARRRIKAHPRLLAAARGVRGALATLRGVRPTAPDPSE